MVGSLLSESHFGRSRHVTHSDPGSLIVLSSLDSARRMRGAAYVIGLLLIIVPLVETVFAALPVHLHEPPWRLGAVNALAGAVGLPLVGLLLCVAVALLTGDRLVLWLASSFCAIAGVLCLLGAGAFSLDAVQMHGQARAGLGMQYWIVSGWAVFKISFCALAFLMLAARSGGAARAARRAAARTPRDARPVVVGRVAAPVLRQPASEGNSVAGDERPIGTR